MVDVGVEEAVPVVPAPAPPAGLTPDEKRAATAKAQSRDRRRPGRKEYANPALISLLRKPAAAAEELNVNVDHLDGSVVRGLLFAVPIGLAMWGAVALVIWLLWP